MADTSNGTPTGQAAVNSNTVLGATLGTLAGLGEDPVFTPAVTTLLVVATKLTQEQAAPIAKTIVIIGGYLWTLYGRKNATLPITGIIKS